MSEDDLEESGRQVTPVSRRKVRFSEWDCPACEANNPYDLGFGQGEELVCCYCGLRFRVEVISGERYKLIPV